jgi:hypothetical protein
MGQIISSRFCRLPHRHRGPEWPKSSSGRASHASWREAESWCEATTPWRSPRLRRCLPFTLWLDEHLSVSPLLSLRRRSGRTALDCFHCAYASTLIRSATSCERVPLKSLCNSAVGARLSTLEGAAPRSLPASRLQDVVPADALLHCQARALGSVLAPDPDPALATPPARPAASPAPGGAETSGRLACCRRSP